MDPKPGQGSVFINNRGGQKRRDFTSAIKLTVTRAAMRPSLTWKRDCVRIFSLKSSTGMRSFMPPYGDCSKFWNSFLRRMWRQIAFIIRRLSVK